VKEIIGIRENAARGVENDFFNLKDVCFGYSYWISK
jgi:hypothetical protein